MNPETLPTARILAYIRLLCQEPQQPDPMTMTARELHLYKRGLETGRQQIEALYGACGDVEGHWLDGGREAGRE